MNRTKDHTSFSRRDALRLGGSAAAALVSAPLLAACGGGSGAKAGEITLATWGLPSEVAAFKTIIDRYNKANPKTKVRLEVKPPDGYQESIDTRLAADSAPDLIRLNYADVGHYAKAGAIVDLSDHVGAAEGAAFDATFWNVVRYEGRPYALPHHTDTVALFYNVDALKKIDAPIPERIEDSWTWDRFIEIANELKREGVGKYPFAMNWQRYAPRWLPFLYQHGGRLLTPGLDKAAINDAKGIEAIAWTQDWFKKGLVPPTTSIRSTEAIEVLFSNGTIPMMLNGDWMIPHLEDHMETEWGVTYMIRDAAMASDLGGNAVAVTRSSKDPELAADFLKFLTNEESMRLFVTQAQFLPVRKSLLEQKLDYEQRPDEMDLFKEQAAKSIPDDMGRLLAHPEFGKKIGPTALEEQLELAFKNDQAPEVTARNIASVIDKTLG